MESESYIFEKEKEIEAMNSLQKKNTNEMRELDMSHQSNYSANIVEVIMIENPLLHIKKSIRTIKSLASEVNSMKNSVNSS